jgi:hypothetical protein
MAGQLTVSESDTVVQRNHLAQAMVMAVARTGSGLYLQEVQDFQRFWNSSLPVTVKQAQAAGVGSSAITQLKKQVLVEDGQYGPKTSVTLGIIVGNPAPPQRASGMTVWYAQNRTRVDGLSPMETVPIDQITTPTPPMTDPSAGVASMTTSVASGSTVRTTVQDVTSPASTVDPSQPMMSNPVVVQPDTSGVIEPAAHSTSKVMIVDMTGPGADIPILAAPRKGGVPIIAMLAGGATLGGLFWWFTRKSGGRRMRHA